jgi:hypothetical protein
MAEVAAAFELAESTVEPVASEPEAESIPAAKVFRLPSGPNCPVRLVDDKPALDLLREWMTMDRQNF